MKKVNKKNKKFSSVLIMTILIILVIMFCVTYIFFGGSKKASAREKNKWGWEDPVSLKDTQERITLDVSRKTGNILLPVVNIGCHGAYIRTTKATFIVYILPSFTSWREYSATFSNILFGQIYYPDECCFLYPKREYIIVFQNCYDYKGQSEIILRNKSSAGHINQKKGGESSKSKEQKSLLFLLQKRIFLVIINIYLI